MVHLQLLDSTCVGVYNAVDHGDVSALVNSNVHMFMCMVVVVVLWWY